MCYLYSHTTEQMDEFINNVKLLRKTQRALDQSMDPRRVATLLQDLRIYTGRVDNQLKQLEDIEDKQTD